MGRIDRLVVKNFKSYGGEQKIGPFKQFSCIIGPNGSGKSNLMDAISFVLGVQTTQLRGSKLLDLVHLKEHESREETKRSAFVEIVYVDEENKLASESFVRGDDETNEVRFRRTIRPDGVAAYTVNGKGVPAKRYQDILKKIGVLVKARNFLVFQGDVANIAQKSPAELTKMFEEISGSVSLAEDYSQKQQACESAEEEVLRSYTLKKSITKEKKQVQEQKQEAEQFQEMQRGLMEKKGELYLWQLFHAQKDLNGNADKAAEMQSELDTVNSEWKTVEEKLKEHGQNCAELRIQKLKLQKRLTKQKRHLDNSKPARIELSTQVSGIKKGAEKAEKELKKLQKSGKKHEEKINSLMNQLSEIKEKKDSFEADESKSENKIEASRLEEYNKKKQEVGAKTAQIQQQLDEAQGVFNSKQKALEKIEKEIDVLEEGRKNTVGALDFNSGKKDRLGKHCKENQEKLDVLSKKLEDLTKTSKSAVARLSQVRKELVVEDSKLHAAQADRQHSSREAKKAEVTETLQRHFKGVHGRLFQLCDLTRREYKMAVTIALGKNMEAIVVDEEKVAVECIKFLKEQRLGKATFIPLDTIRVHVNNQDHIRQLGGTFKLVIDVFKYEEATHKALLYACGNTLICDTQAEAKKLCYSGETAGKYKVVTKDGTIFHKSGNMSGGFSTKDKARTSKWDAQEVARVQERRNNLHAELIRLERQERTESSSREVSAQVEAFKQKLRFSKMDLDYVTKKVEGYAADLKRTDKELAKKKVAKQKLEAELAKDQHKIDAIRKKISKVSATVFAEFSRSIGVSNIAEYEEKRLAAAEERMKRKVELAEAESRLLGALEYEKSRDNQDSIKRLNKKIDMLKRKLGEKEKELIKFDSNLKKTTEGVERDTKQIDSLKAEMAKLEAGASDTKTKEKALKSKITKLERSIITVEAEREKLVSVRDEVIKQAQMDQVDIPRVGSQSTGRRKRGKNVLQEGDFDYNLLKENLEVKDEKDYDRIKQGYLDNIAEMESTLQKISPNMKAFDQFSEVEKRLRNMKDEFDKKRNGQAQIQKQFEDILQERTKMFNGLFEHVKDNIDKVYKSLTKSAKHPMGGNAYLNLEDPEKPFLSGIKYNAMPPGKRFRDMDQLSGGEKTVAALALLFAIHSCHPAPFFVLDEVDAALDGVNVNKVSNYVRSRTQDDALQCIVISLKDTFYHKADALIGIFKDQDVETSGSITIDLREYDSEKKSKTATLSHSAVFGSQRSMIDEASEDASKKSPAYSRRSRKRSRQTPVRS